MNDSNTTNTRGTDRFDCGLRQYERNRYFHGKLMTARDMQTEQRYHAGRMHTHSRYVTGVGIVCGLGVDVEKPPDDSGSPTAIIEKGVAVDACGRQIVVDDEHHEEIPPGDISSGGSSSGTAGNRRVSVYIQYATCKAESVPVAGSEEACGNECEYNRLRQTFEVTFESSPPDGQKPVPVDRVELPTLAKVREDGDDDQVDPTDDVLHELSQSYHEATNGDGWIRSCASVIESQTTADGGQGRSATHDRLFLGRFEEQDDGSWKPVTDGTEPRPYVYTNEMLHAGLVDHVTDFGNPHDVVATVDKAVPVDGNVELKSTDNTVKSDRIPGEGAVDVRVSQWLQDDINHLAEYVRDKSLKYTIEAFYDVAETYADDPSDGADEVVDRAVELILRARDALEAREFDDGRSFATVVLELARTEQELLETLDQYVGELVTDGSLGDYRDAVERLLDLLPRTGDGQLRDNLPAGFEPTVELAVAQDQLCETAKWLERPDEETMTLPGGTEVERRIIEDAIEPTRGVEQPVDPSLEGGPSTIESGETASFGVNFGTASGVGLEVENEQGVEVFEANLQRGSDATVPLQFETGELDASEPRMAVGGDATLTVVTSGEREALEEGEYTLTLSAPDVSGNSVESTTMTVKDAEEEEEAVPPSLEDNVISVVAGETASFDVNFGTAPRVGIEIEGEGGTVFEANLQGSDATVTLRFETGELDASAPRMTVAGNATLTNTRSPSRIGRGSLDEGDYGVNLRTPDLNGDVEDTATMRIMEGVDIDAFDPGRYEGRSAGEVAGELYGRYGDVTVNYQPPSETDVAPGTIVEATPPQGEGSTPTITVVGTGFDNIGGIGPTNRENLFENGIFTAEEFSATDRGSLGGILSNNVSVDDVLENVNRAIDIDIP